VDVNLLVRRY